MLRRRCRAPRCTRACVREWLVARKNAVTSVSAFDWFRVLIGLVVLFACVQLMLMVSAPATMSVDIPRTAPPLPAVPTRLQAAYTDGACTAPVFVQNAGDAEPDAAVALLVAARTLLDTRRQPRTRFVVLGAHALAQDALDALPYFVQYAQAQVLAGAGPSAAVRALPAEYADAGCIVVSSNLTAPTAPLLPLFTAVEEYGGLPAAYPLCACDADAVPGVCVYGGVGAAWALGSRACALDSVLESPARAVAGTCYAACNDTAGTVARAHAAMRTALGLAPPAATRLAVTLPVSIAQYATAAATLLFAALAGIAYTRMKQRLTPDMIETLRSQPVPANDVPPDAVLLQEERDGAPSPSQTPSPAESTDDDDSMLLLRPRNDAHGERGAGADAV